MAIDRTQFNLLVDDDGSGNTGSVISKSTIENVILTPTDAAIAALGVWTPYTPSFGSSLTVGNGVASGHYIQLNDLVFWQVHLTAGSTTVMPLSYVSMYLPVNLHAATEAAYSVGTAVYRNTSGYFWLGSVIYETIASVVFYVDGSPVTALNNSNPFTLAASSQYFASGFYRA